MKPSIADEFDAIAGPPVQTRLNDNEVAALLRVVHEGGYCIGIPGGPEGEAFEKAFTEKVGCADAVSVNSCSSALELSAILVGLQPGDEVILPAHTFVATAVPMGKTGATLKWADIDPDTRVISAQSVQALITPRTKVIVPVHLYGLPADMDAIMAIAKEHKLKVIEDCAQANGAVYKGKCVGSFGDFGCFSFQGAKNMSTLGEGGMLTVRDQENATLARRMRWMGNWLFEDDRSDNWIPAGNNLVQPMGDRWPGNYCMPEALAAVGTQLLKRLDLINDQRRRQAQRFMEGLEDYPEIEFQRVPDGCEHVYHLMASRYNATHSGRKRDDLIRLLRQKYNVNVIVQYWPLYRSELFKKFGFGEADVPQTDRFFDNMVSFPWWSDMSDELLDDMAARTRSALDELRG